MSINETLFGSVKKLVADGGHVVDLANLQREFDSSDAVMYLFCSGCGTYLEVNKPIAEQLLLDIDESRQMAGKEYYFEAKSCEVCADKAKEVQVKKI